MKALKLQFLCLLAAAAVPQFAGAVGPNCSQLFSHSDANPATTASKTGLSAIKPALSAFKTGLSALNERIAKLEVKLKNEQLALIAQNPVNAKLKSIISENSANYMDGWFGNYDGQAHNDLVVSKTIKELLDSGLVASEKLSLRSRVTNMLWMTKGNVSDLSLAVRYIEFQNENNISRPYDSTLAVSYRSTIALEPQLENLVKVSKFATDLAETPIAKRIGTSAEAKDAIGDLYFSYLAKAGIRKNFAQRYLEVSKAYVESGAGYSSNAGAQNTAIRALVESERANGGITAEVAYHLSENFGMYGSLPNMLFDKYIEYPARDRMLEEKSELEKLEEVLRHFH